MISDLIYILGDDVKNVIPNSVPFSLNYLIKTQHARKNIKK